MFGIVDAIKLVIGCAVGAAFGLGYAVLVREPAVRAETRTIVEAEAEARTKEALNAVSDAAERARAMRRYCADRGLLYDFTTGKCIGTGASIRG